MLVESCSSGQSGLHVVYFSSPPSPRPSLLTPHFPYVYLIACTLHTLRATVATLNSSSKPQDFKKKTFEIGIKQRKSSLIKTTTRYKVDRVTRKSVGLYLAGFSTSKVAFVQYKMCCVLRVHLNSRDFF